MNPSATTTLPANPALSADTRPLDVTQTLGSAAAQPVYIEAGAEHVFAVYHRPGPGVARDCAVVLCPPFGWEETSAHRSLRAWANQLATAGYPTVRPTFAGTGDSTGNPHDPRLLDAWTESFTATVSWVRAASGAASVVAVGMSFGSLIAYYAVARGAAVDGLVLWSPPMRGRDIVRQQRAFSRLELAESFRGFPPPPPAPAGDLAAGGFLLSGETVAALNELDLTTLEIPAGRLSSGVLLLDRDGITAADGLRDALQRQGIAVSHASGDGYADMTSHPQEATLPPALASAVQAWLDKRSQPALDALASVRAAGTSSLTLGAGDRRVTETPVSIEQPFGTLSGILTTPARAAEDLCVVFLNAGAIRRTGPNRMWVEIARRWAARGVASLRLDLEGIGESDGPDDAYQRTARLHLPRLVAQVAAALDYLQARGIAQRFVLVGMCAGAYWSFQAALDDPRISAIFMVNPAVLVWDDGLGTARDLHRALASRAILRIREPDSRARIRAIARWLLGASARRIRGALTGSPRLPSISAMNETALERLRASEVRVLFLFAAGESLEDDLVRWGRMATLEAASNVCVERIAVINHTLRPSWAQARAHEILDRALDRELRAAVAPGPDGSET